MDDWPLMMRDTLLAVAGFCGHPLLLLLETLVVAVEVLTQKLWMLSLAPLERIGMSDGGVDGRASRPASDGRVCIVTGPTSGIGKEIASEMYRRGYTVVLACRNRAKGDQLAAELHRSKTGKRGGRGGRGRRGGKEAPPPLVMILDVSSLASVREFVDEWNESVKLPVHVLVNNAGIFSMSAPREETRDGFESHIGTNHLGHFLLSEMMLPWLKKARQETGGPARVVNVSSKLHRMGRVHVDDPHLVEKGSFNSLAAYAQSKLAQVMFAKEFGRRYDGVVRCLSVHPGEVLTDVVRSLPGAMQRMYKLVMRLFLLTPAQGACDRRDAFIVIILVGLFVRCLSVCFVHSRLFARSLARSLAPGARSAVFCATSADIDGDAAYKGVFYVDSDCRPGSPNRLASDNELVDWLWKWSTASCGLQSSRKL